ncbi:MAG: DUF4416 family protein [Thermodesulfobacteriota bacterium]
MSLPQLPPSAKLVISLLMADKSLYGIAGKALVQRFGPVDLASSWLGFDYTDYYAPEMGKPLFRRMLAFKNPIRQEELPAVKLATNRMEQQLAGDGKRRVNIDPGYLVMERFVLASGKNYSHRIYLGEGIYADLTLLYQKKAFQKLPWTYPDYADTGITTFLEAVRKKYRFDLQLLPAGNSGAGSRETP